MVFVALDITQLVMYLPSKNEVFSHCASPGEGEWADGQISKT